MSDTPRTDALELEVSAFKQHVQADGAFHLCRQLEREVARCHARLEIDHIYQVEVDGMVRREIPYEERTKYPDGIDCRNETIKLLQRTVKLLQRK